MRIIFQIFFHGLAVEQLVKNFLYTGVILQQVPFKIGMGIAHPIGMGEVQVHRFGRRQVFSVIPEPGLLQFSEFQLRRGESGIVFIDGDIDSLAVGDAVNLEVVVFVKYVIHYLDRVLPNLVASAHGVRRDAAK